MNVRLLTIYIAIFTGIICVVSSCKPTSTTSKNLDGFDWSKRSRPLDESDRLFQSEHVLELQLEIAPRELQDLRENPRKYVRATILEKQGVKLTSYELAIKLKGAAGSFREIDDRPAFTINVGKYIKGQEFHGLDKFHLNNSVQDESYCNEFLCSELFLSAGLPAAHVSFARVRLNDRDLGLYVLKESFDRKFLERQFKNPLGNLYDGGFLQDLDAELERDSGDGPNDRSDLKRLADACREADTSIRFSEIEKLVDVPAFLKFFAMEQMTCHWDGYTHSANNYRLYFEPKTHKAILLPHGMDQMFGDPNFSVHDIPGTMLTQAILENPAWREQYFKVLEELLPKFSPSEPLTAKIDNLKKRLTPVLLSIDKERAESHFNEMDGTKERVRARCIELHEQIVNHKIPPPPEPSDSIEFDDVGVADLADWTTAGETDAQHEVVEMADDRQAYVIRCTLPDQPTIASWRRRTTLEAGSYVLSGMAKCDDIDALSEPPGTGAGLRISGSVRSNSLEGTRDWELLEFEFTIDETREIEFVAELRATNGQVWFDSASMKLKRQVEITE